MIKVNGAALTGPRDFIVPYLETVEVTLTIERGPEAYEYNGLQIGLVSGCEYARNQALSFPTSASGDQFYAIQTLGVSFTEPCSDVDLFNPKDGWLIKQGPSELPITIVAYDKGDADLAGVKLQYRPADGNGAWINMTCPKDPRSCWTSNRFEDSGSLTNSACPTLWQQPVKESLTPETKTALLDHWQLHSL